MSHCENSVRSICLYCCVDGLTWKQPRMHQTIFSFGSFGGRASPRGRWAHDCEVEEVDAKDCGLNLSLCDLFTNLRRFTEARFAPPYSFLIPRRLTSICFDVCYISVSYVDCSQSYVRHHVDSPEDVRSGLPTFTMLSDQSSGVLERCGLSNL
jgi:hypothetical protein